MLRQIHAYRAAAETHLKIMVKQRGKWTGIGCLLETVESVLIAEVFGLAKILKSVLCTFEVLRALNSIDELLDFLSVFLFHLFYEAEYFVSPAIRLQPLVRYYSLSIIILTLILPSCQDPLSACPASFLLGACTFGLVFQGGVFSD